MVQATNCVAETQTGDILPSDLFGHPGGSVGADLIRMRNEMRRQEEQLAAARRRLRALAAELRKTRHSEQARVQEVADAQEETAVRLLCAVGFHDEETGAHIRRVGLYTRAVCRASSMANGDLMYRAARLHDVGKIGIPNTILRKPGKLDDAQWGVMREHTRIGAEMLAGSKSPELKTACTIAATHHENFDGTGYPAGLTGRDIPIEGRIVRLVDTYDALRMWRPYKPAFDHREAVHIILEGDGRTRPEHFDPDLLKVFSRSHAIFESIFSQSGERPGAARSDWSTDMP